VKDNGLPETVIGFDPKVSSFVLWEEAETAASVSFICYRIYR